MGSVEHLNPEGLNQNPAFTNVIVVEGAAKTVYIGGQDAIDGTTGQIVGKGDFKAQVEQVFKNLLIALDAADAGLEHVVKWNLYVMRGQPLQIGFEVFRQVWGKRPNPPTITFMFVAGLANPDFLCEMDAIAVVPE